MRIFFFIISSWVVFPPLNNLSNAKSSDHSDTISNPQLFLNIIYWLRYEVSQINQQILALSIQNEAILLSHTSSHSQQVERNMIVSVQKAFLINTQTRLHGKPKQSTLPSRRQKIVIQHSEFIEGKGLVMVSNN